MVGRMWARTFLVVLCVSIAMPAASQTSVSTTVTVVATASGAGVRGLSFGTVPLGTSTVRSLTAEADSTGPGIAHFSFSGLTGNAAIQLTFDFPAQLTRIGGNGVMPVDFDAANFALRCFDRTNVVATACAFFNPSPAGADPSALVVTKPGSQYTRLRVYLGGRASPGASLRAGAYQGVVSLTIARI